MIIEEKFLSVVLGKTKRRIVAKINSTIAIDNDTAGVKHMFVFILVD